VSEASAAPDAPRPIGHGINWMQVVLPVATLAIGVGIWDLVVRIGKLPPYVLPSPGRVADSLVSNWPVLWSSLLVTLTTTFEGLGLALVGGIGLAILFNQSRVHRKRVLPLCGDPAGDAHRRHSRRLLLIYLPQQAAVLACAWIVAFFPVLANTTLGLNSVDRNLGDLFDLYGASRLSVLLRLKLPSALPYMLGGLKIAGGLSLIGAVVAEIAAGSAGAGSGLAYRIVEVGLPTRHPAHVRRTDPVVGGRLLRSSSRSPRCRTCCCAAGTKRGGKGAVEIPPRLRGGQGGGSSCNLSTSHGCASPHPTLPSPKTGGKSVGTHRLPTLRPVTCRLSRETPSRPSPWASTLMPVNSSGDCASSGLRSSTVKSASLPTVIEPFLSSWPRR